jgi:aryl-alcohol dehydrogenase-like predicted oxidoreductase
MPFDPSLGLSHYVPAVDRYERGRFRRCGRNGMELPLISLGLWQNFGDDRPLANSRAILRRAFDRGITHFDLANNYGPPYGSAEKNFGRIFADDFRPYRDELVISTSSVEQLEQNMAALDHLDFEADELEEIDRYAVEGHINIWKPSSTA